MPEQQKNDHVTRSNLHCAKDEGKWKIKAK